MHLVFALMLAIMGSICTSYYAKNYNEKEFNPLSIYIGFLFYDGRSRNLEVCGVIT